MVKPGLASVTFRQLSVEEITALAAESGLIGIEWGGDVHVPHGEVSRAHMVKRITLDAGLEVASYGSYYRCNDNVPFSDVLKTAAALEAPVIRVWAGTKGSREVSTDERVGVVENARKIADLAAAEGIKIAFEYHSNTLTDTPASVLQLLEELDHDNVYTYWQPLPTLTVEERVLGLKQIKAHLYNLHVFAWTDQSKRLKLAAGEALWKQYFAVLQGLPGEHYALIEFVKHDAPEQLRADAKVLHQWLAGYL